MLVGGCLARGQAGSCPLARHYPYLGTESKYLSSCSRNHGNQSPGLYNHQVTPHRSPLRILVFLSTQ